MDGPATRSGRARALVAVDDREDVSAAWNLINQRVHHGTTIFRVFDVWKLDLETTRACRQVSGVLDENLKATLCRRVAKRSERRYDVTFWAVRFHADTHRRHPNAGALYAAWSILTGVTDM
jgi:hypothetical protein